MAAAEEESLDDLLAFMDEDAAGPAAPVVPEEVAAEEAEEEFEEPVAAPEPAPKKTRAPRASKQADVEAVAPAGETAAQRRIRELQAELDRPETNPTTPEGRPLPESQLTEEQKQVRELEDRVARKKAEDLVKAEHYEATKGENTILIHFVDDGLTAQGRVWMRGQEIEFDRNGLAYEQTKDLDGNSWLDLAGDDMAQVQKWGKIMFRPGPWPGLRLDESEISAAERRRNRAAPIL